ncbi:FUSC family protein [Salipiger pallidus]|uniref:FUSC family protein n=1 Tax=Salipiger pallidus TaxID=1775170 RepID=A0A8J2ZLA0_9RHOB|nr:FUSC family protein [Salipiger pallidus]GGG76507.1 FUSC family protein [Salipiger pallidus]
MTDLSKTPRHLSSRREALRHLFAPDHLAAGFRLGPQPYLRNSLLAGFQAGITAAIALPLVLLSPWAHMVGFAALGGMVALFGRFDTTAGRLRVVTLAALTQIAMVMVLSLVSLSPSPWLHLGALTLACGLAYLVAISGRFGPPGALIFVFAGGAALVPASGLGDVAERSIATAVVATLAFVVCLATEWLRQRPTPERPLPVEPLRPMSHRLIASGRIMAGCAVALVVSHLWGASHPVWAGMGALLVLQGPFLHINMHRAQQRMAGAVVGSLLAWVILAQEPGPMVIIALIFVLQMCTELVIGANYWLGQIFVTPMALIMSYLAAPGLSGAQMAPERVLDSLLGVVIGIAAAVLLSTLDDRHHLAAVRTKGA